MSDHDGVEQVITMAWRAQPRVLPRPGFKRLRGGVGGEGPAAGDGKTGRLRTARGVVNGENHTSGKPILFLPSEPERSDLPEGWTDVQIEGQTYSANFVKIAINLVRRPGEPGEPGENDNELPRILRGWFGPDAGAPGTRHTVALDRRGADWHLAPLGQRRGELQLWRAYSREEIPPLLGLEFSTAIWNAGFVKRPGHIFLLTTLDKSGHGSQFQYKDHFVSATEFEWQTKPTPHPPAHQAAAPPQPLQAGRGNPLNGGGSAKGKGGGGGALRLSWGRGDLGVGGWEPTKLGWVGGGGVGGQPGGGRRRGQGKPEEGGGVPTATPPLSRPPPVPGELPRRLKPFAVCQK